MQEGRKDYMKEGRTVGREESWTDGWTDGRKEIKEGHEGRT
jgi:hypothetical protein